MKLHAYLLATVLSTIAVFIGLYPQQYLIWIICGKYTETRYAPEYIIVGCIALWIAGILLAGVSSQIINKWLSEERIKSMILVLPLMCYMVLVPTLRRAETELAYSKYISDNRRLYDDYWSILNAVRYRGDFFEAIQLMDKTAFKSVRRTRVSEYIYPLGFLGYERVFRVLYNEDNVPMLIEISAGFPT
mgnify:CR=1 FL=1